MTRGSPKAALVFAAGHSQRWDRDYPKVLASLGDYTVLERTLTQLYQRGYGEEWPCVVVYRDERVRDAVRRVQRATKSSKLLYYLTQERHSDFICRELAASRKLWADERTIVILGDVVWSWTAMDQILGFATPMTIVGAKFEIFGLSMTRKVYEKAHGIMSIQANKAENQRAKIQAGKAEKGWGGMGRLWSFYRAWEGLPERGKHQIKQPGVYHLLPTTDYTTDIDHEKDYEHFMERVVKPGLLEEV